MPESVTKRQLAISNILGSGSTFTPATLIGNLAKDYDKISPSSLSRDLNVLMTKGLVQKLGHGRATVYFLTPLAKLVLPVEAKSYFQINTDERKIFQTFQFGIFELIESTSIFSQTENSALESLASEYKIQSLRLSPTVIKKEWERITIEFSWKSSAMEGNTYSLLETENLLREGIPAPGKTTEETQMILNHKNALAFVREHSDLFREVDIKLIEEVHSILVEGLQVRKGLRTTLVGITGTKFRPLDNQFQIREAMEMCCRLIAAKLSAFEKSILSILLISYVQPFEDGNKRTSRLIGNALLLATGLFPLSFRSTTNDEYKMAILLFYERNNLSLFKKVFMDQAEFSVKNYFRSQAASI